MLYINWHVTLLLYLYQGWTEKRAQRIVELNHAATTTNLWPASSSFRRNPIFYSPSSYGGAKKTNFKFTDKSKTTFLLSF